MASKEEPPPTDDALSDAADAGASDEPLHSWVPWSTAAVEAGLPLEHTNSTGAMRPPSG